MKALVAFAVVCSLVVSSETCFADFLACDLPATGTPTASRIEVTPPSGPVVVIDGMVVITGSVVKLLDLAPFVGGGLYKFRAEWTDAGGWWSGYSPFLSQSKMGVPGGLRRIP